MSNTRRLLFGGAIRPRSFFLHPSAFLLLFVCLLPTPARACWIPVFRYALERWELSRYELSVFHEGELAGGLDAALLAAEKSGANLRVTTVDLGRPLSAAQQAVWNRQPGDKSLPWAVVRLSDAAAEQPDAWSGPLDEAGLKQLLDSPLRRQLAKHLGNGVSAVFLLLASGQQAEDRAARELLDDELARLEKLVQLPEPDTAGPKLLSALPLRVAFVTLELQRDDPAEAMFVRMLEAGDPEIAKVSGPVVLPIFGRGRMLCSLFGDDLSKQQLQNVVRFLTSKCSCEVKELNPGVDLLIAADWQRSLQVVPEATVQGRGVQTVAAAPRGTADESPNTAVPVPAPAPVATPLVLPAAETQPGMPASAVSPWLWAAVVLSGLLVVFTAVRAFGGPPRP